MRKPLVAGNWKMNGDSKSISALLDEIVAALDKAALRRCEVLVFPSFVYLGSVVARLVDREVGVGAQDVDAREGGAVTGAVSALMVKNIGCGYAIVGHSERRTLFGENDQMVAEKYARCLAAGLTPILCVGETLDERRADKTIAVVTRQLEAVTAKVGVAGMSAGLVAYEPVWAIGTGESATPDQAEEVHRALRDRLTALDKPMAVAMRLLYGGSVNAENAESLFSMENVDGALVGGASLQGQSFVDICNVADGIV